MAETRRELSERLDQATDALRGYAIPMIGAMGLGSLAHAPGDATIRRLTACLMAAAIAGAGSSYVIDRCRWPGARTMERAALAATLACVPALCLLAPIMGALSGWTHEDIWAVQPSTDVGDTVVEAAIVGTNFLAAVTAYAVLRGWREARA